MESWTNLCRCCLSPDSEVSLLDEENNVKEKFLEITTIEVNPEDNLPQKLCNDCYQVMSSAYQFRRQCIRMDTELKIQLEALFQQSKENELAEENDGNNQNLKKDLRSTGKQANSHGDLQMDDNTLKQLTNIIKKEPKDDSDDDYCYVIVIDDPKKQNNEESIKTNEQDQATDVELEKINVKLEKDHPTEIHEEPLSKPENEQTQPSASASQSFESAYDSFLISNNKVPANVPATILENEEESQENDSAHFEHTMDVDSQDSTSQDVTFIPEEPDSQNAELIVPDSEIITGTQEKNDSYIKILTTSGGDGTYVFKDSSGSIQYLTSADTQLVTTNAEDGDSANQEEVIFCEGDDSSQFQILKCDGSELVIEYADGDQIATVFQQEDGTFLCDCGEQFEDLSEYESHQYKHNPGGEHLCSMCGKGFETVEILTGHMVLHNVSGISVTCPFCNQLVRRNTLTQHIKYNHNNAKPECTICWKTFANPNNLKRHLMIHTGVREFECDICAKRFHQKITMQTHRMTHMNPYACNQCDLTFENKNALLEHKASNQCTKSKVKKVKEELMKTVKQEVTTNLGKLLGYACSLCKKMFSVESALEQHVEITHMMDPSELICSDCGDVLPTKKDMQTHILVHKNYKQKNMKRFECKTCGKSCSSQAMLIMHERVHTNERPFPCGLCSLRFKTKTHLRTHQLTHTREKKFGCSVCMKFFALKGNLVVHLRTHTGERPYVCNLCDEAFIDSKYLKKHKLKKHAIDNVPWNQY